ncbi:MAG: aminotransferase class IV [Actinomycetes bacterium]
MSSVWLNGEFLQGDGLTFSAFDHPFLRGDGIFESTRTEGARIFFLRRHLERLARSAQLLEMERPDLDELARSAKSVVDNSQIPESGSLRISIFSNGDHLITHRSQSTVSELPRLAIYPERQYSQSRIQTAKSLSYARSAAALRWAEKAGAEEVIFLDENGFAMETALANFVAEIAGELVTPNLENGALRGITRSLALEWFPSISERDITQAELESASGILVLSGVRFIRPAAALNGRALQNSAAMQTIASEFELRARANPNY